MKKKKSAVTKFVGSIFNGGDEYSTVQKEKAAFPLRAIIIAAITTVFVLLFVFSIIEISGLSADIAGMKKEMVFLTSKEGKLRDDLAHKYSFSEIEKEAEKMGFRKEPGKIVAVD